MPPILLNARELAARLDVRYDTVLGWARRDEIPSIRDGRKRRLFNLDSVLNALRPASDPGLEDAQKRQATCA
jgi:excisionase family DNA binding protein